MMPAGIDLRVSISPRIHVEPDHTPALTTALTAPAALPVHDSLVIPMDLFKKSA